MHGISQARQWRKWVDLYLETHLYNTQSEEIIFSPRFKQCTEGNAQFYQITEIGQVIILSVTPRFKQTVGTWHVFLQLRRFSNSPGYQAINYAGE